MVSVQDDGNRVDDSFLQDAVADGGQFLVTDEQDEQNSEDFSLSLTQFSALVHQMATGSKFQADSSPDSKCRPAEFSDITKTEVFGGDSSNTSPGSRPATVVLRHQSNVRPPKAA